MTPEKLKSERLSLRLERSEMAEMLETPASTYNDWESGRSAIPGIVNVAIRVIKQEDRPKMASVVAKILDRIERNHPAGINHA